MLDDAALGGEVALENGNAAVCALGIFKRADDIGAQRPAAQMCGFFAQQLVAVLVKAALFQRVQIFAERFPSHRHCVEVQHGADLLHHAGDAAGIVEILRGPVAGGTDVEQIVRPAVHPVEGVSIDLDAEFVRDGGQVHRRVGGAGDRGMDHDGVFKAFFGHDVLRADALLQQLEQLDARIVSGLFQLRGSGGHQRGARQHQPEGLGHDLHGGGCAHKGARAAAGAGVVLIIAQLLAGDDAGFFPCVEFADLLERQELVDRAGGILHGVFLRQGMGFHDAAGDDDGAHFLEPPDAHQHGGNGLVAACDEYAAVKSACVRLRLHQIDDGFTVGEGVIDAVVSLCDTVAQIGGKIAGGFAAVLVDRLHGLSYKLIEMRAAGMAVAKGALYHDLGFAQIINRPSHADLQRIALWCKCAYLLRM